MQTLFEWSRDAAVRKSSNVNIFIQTFLRNLIYIRSNKNAKKKNTIPMLMKKKYNSNADVKKNTVYKQKKT